jgi:hypothetical protein
VGLVPLQTLAPATTGALWDNEEGNVVSVRQAHALVAQTPNKRLHVEDTSFAQSRDPCTSTVTHPKRVKALEGCEQADGRFGIAVGQTCASRRNRHRGRDERTLARLAARHRFGAT